MARFDYLEPQSLDEALGMLEKHGARARLVAGSTDFLVRWRTGVWRPEISCVYAARSRVGWIALQR